MSLMTANVLTNGVLFQCFMGLAGSALEKHEYNGNQHADPCGYSNIVGMIREPTKLQIAKNASSQFFCATHENDPKAENDVSDGVEKFHLVPNDPAQA